MNKIICVGREFGSGGQEIAAIAAAKLGIHLYERELLYLACRYGEVSEKTLGKSDEKATNPYLYEAVYEGNYQVMRGMPTSEVLYALQSHEIQKIAAHESCIFVGRCADYVLRDAKEVQLLRVFVSAPFESRVRRKMALEQLSHDKAAHLVKKTDKQRKKYYDTYTQQIWGDPAFYDMNLDSAETGVEGTADLIVERYRNM